MSARRELAGLLLAVAVPIGLWSAGCTLILDVPNFTELDASLDVVRDAEAGTTDAPMDVSREGATDAPVDHAGADGGCSGIGVSPYYLYPQSPLKQTLSAKYQSAFVVEVVDVNLQPRPGVLVVWREPMADPRSFVSVSAANGNTSATQFSLTPGNYTETAALVDPSWSGTPNMFAGGCVPTVAPTTGTDGLATVVTFSFTQE